MPEQIYKRNLSVAICDDDALILEKMGMLAKETLSPEWELSLTCETSPHALLENADPFQIVLLDIQLLNCSGIDVAKTLIAQNPECRLIFVSGYPRYVSDVYDVPHMCLVLKDQMKEQLPRFLLRAAREVSVQSAQMVTVRVKGEQRRLCVSGICFLERREHRTFIHMHSGQCIQTREKLDELLAQTHSRQLCRCHVSFVVNLDWVVSMQGKDFILRDGKHIPISRVNRQAAKEAFFSYLRERI